ncbi:Glucan endo-1,3-beta-D-glucosidase [Handroanthus impetiginosus]|uniref:Glucan endo-1,3-beta-D-glucosidase n=1 Tax=Handroanthus impetiginosus TaxID=429701 RepID=A0A2G9GSS0_9LAMI|nr:Glucan endo-1,3-beta-D-glucosidase [Handroanthus impetiginosus]
MEKHRILELRLCILALFVVIGLVQCDSTKAIHLHIKVPRKLAIDMPLDSSNTGPYVSSPFSMPPFGSLPPVSDNAPPYCENPPSTIPSPVAAFAPPPPPASSGPTLPGPSPIPPSSPESPMVPSPPTNVPTPTEPILSPPYYEPSPPSSVPGPPYYEPSPPSSVPSPPYYIPSPTGNVPSPRFLPPIVFPPPTVPPPPRRTPTTALWCVAKASVPDPIIQEAMNYACASGADCDQIQPSGSCYQPNTLFAHASYAFNSYWQRTKVAGGTCDFGGTAVLVTVDPSYDGCHFLYF